MDRAQGPSVGNGCWAAVLALVLVGVVPCAPAQSFRGLPFTRSYPLEEMGNVSRGVKLNFDPFGRLAVIQEGAYVVLNDTAWVDMADKPRPGVSGMANVVHAPDGRLYYGARGSWGIVERTAAGRLWPASLVPANAPLWTRTNSFDHIVATSTGVYFAGWSGVAYWDFATRESRLFELAGAAEIFRVGARMFVSAHGRPIHEIDVARGELRVVPGTDARSTVDFAAALDERHSLICMRGGEILIFDGREAAPWPAQERHGLIGKVSALHALAGGGMAVAITGKGLFLLSADGELMSSLTTPQYHRITALATREPGVLWVAVEDGIEKVLYGGPLTVFGQRLGLPVSWPTVRRWGDRIIVATSGQLYQAMPGPPGAPARFEPMKPLPPGGVWGLVVHDQQLLVGNSLGVFAAEPDGQFTQVLSTNLIHLAMTGDDLCFAIGHAEIAVLRWADGRWSEAAPRIEGRGFPAVVHAARHSVWIEFGANQVARLSLQDGRLQWQTFEDLPWQNAPWVNVGVIDDLVVLSGAPGQRAFVDELTGTPRAAPELEQLLARSPYWITRIRKDESGALWAGHHRGIVLFTPKGGGYEMDASTFDLIEDFYPVVHVLPENDIWITGGRSLLHVEARGPTDAPPILQPRLVSLLDGRTNVECLDADGVLDQPLRLPYRQNSLSFRFFSGSYAWRRAPSLEYRLNGRDQWATLAPGSLLSFADLREGGYRLEVRMVQASRSPVQPIAFEFEVLPPWYRTTPAYASYVLGLLVAFVGIVRWSSQHARHRNLVLEQLVRARTGELKRAMEKLNEETRNAATLAERDRLAGEIHDSLQQGLSGLMLQIDATLKLPSLSADVRSRLSVARNMVSFTRHEVQNAVWDLESPLLEEGELGDALRKLTGLINSGPSGIEIFVSGAPVSLPPRVKHHLLRIAQEAIANAVRHAEARRIAIELEYRAGALALAIVDDGVGFHPGEVLSQEIGHFGLRGLRSRAGKIGGELSIESSPASGTRIRVVVPLSHHAHSLSDASTATV